MPAKKILPKILLILGFLALFAIVRYRAPLKEKLLFNIEKIKAHKDNFFFESGPGMERRRPVSLLERETELRLYVGEPFNNFSAQDWREFWDIVYGVYAIEPPEKNGLPKKMRQFTRDEIALELMQKYPQPFANFKEEHWKIFFGIVLKK